MSLFQSPSVLGFALALGAGSLPALAQDAPAPQIAAHDWTQGRMAERLKLTDDQKARIRAITARLHPVMAARGRAAADARRAFFDALDRPETSAEGLQALHRNMTELAFEQLMEARTLRLETRAVLDPGQREMAALMEGRKEGMRGPQRGPEAPPPSAS
jgi:Spy/CpxP family protein refolding chaperone